MIGNWPGGRNWLRAHAACQNAPWPRDEHPDRRQRPASQTSYNTM